MRNLALMLAPLAVLAAPLAAAPAETISHADIDLTTRDGVEQFNRRIESKVRTMCKTGIRSVAARHLEQQCRAAALAEARAKARIAIAQANANKARLAEAATASRSANPGA